MPEKEIFTSKSEKETFNHGLRFAKNIKILPTLILLEGQVGAGKTSWVKGFIFGYLKNKNIVSSPSYSLMNAYRGNKREVIHADFYRLQSSDDLESTGFWDTLQGKRVVIVEWAGLIQEWPKSLSLYKVKFEIKGETTRLLEMS